MAATTNSHGYLRFHAQHAHLGSAFGAGWFGSWAEHLARFFGTPPYLITQTAIVAAWIAFNARMLVSFDPYPFILLNLAFSLQAAYAAPLILLAQTRQAERDKMWTDADAHHREDLAQNTLKLLEQNTELTQRVEELAQEVRKLTADIHRRVVEPGG